MAKWFRNTHEFVRQQDRRTVWTLVECGDSDGEVIISGYHWVNRLGYFVSKVPVPDGMSVEVTIEQGERDDDDWEDEEDDDEIVAEADNMQAGSTSSEEGHTS